MLLNPTYRQLIVLYQEHDELDHRQDLDIYEHVNIHYDEDMSKITMKIYVIQNFADVSAIAEWVVGSSIESKSRSS